MSDQQECRAAQRRTAQAQLTTLGPGARLTRQSFCYNAGHLTSARPGMSNSRTLDYTCELIRRASVTPEDAGCQQWLADKLTALGFRCEHLRFGEVDNLWARRGDSGPLLVFAGHTDVVPSGDERKWTS